MSGGLKEVGGVSFRVVSDTESLERDLSKAKRQLRELRQEAINAGEQGLRKGFGDALDDAEFKVRRLQTQMVRAKEGKASFAQQTANTTKTLAGFQQGVEVSATSLSGFASAFGGLSNQFGAFAGFGSNIIRTFMVGGPLVAGFTALAGAAGLVASKLIDVREKAKEAAEAAEQSQLKLGELVEAQRSKLTTSLTTGGKTVNPAIEAIAQEVALKRLEQTELLAQIDLINQAEQGSGSALQQLVDNDAISGFGGIGDKLEAAKALKQETAERAAILQGEVELLQLDAQHINALQNEYDSLIQKEKDRVSAGKAYTKELEKQLKEINRFNLKDLDNFVANAPEGSTFDLGTGETGYKTMAEEVFELLRDSSEDLAKMFSELDKAGAGAVSSLDYLTFDHQDVQLQKQLDDFVSNAPDGAEFDLGTGETSFPQGAAAGKRNFGKLNQFLAIGSSAASGDAMGMLSGAAGMAGPAASAGMAAVKIVASLVEKLVTSLTKIVNVFTGIVTDLVSSTPNGSRMTAGMGAAGGALAAGATGALVAGGPFTAFNPISWGIALAGGAAAATAFSMEVAKGTETYSRVQQALNSELQGAVDLAEPLAEQLFGVIRPLGPLAEGAVEVGVAITEMLPVFPVLFTGLKLLGLAVINAAIFIKGSLGEDTSSLFASADALYGMEFDTRDNYGGAGGIGGSASQVTHRLDEMSDAIGTATESISGIPKWFDVRNAAAGLGGNGFSTGNHEGREEGREGAVDGEGRPSGTTSSGGSHIGSVGSMNIYITTNDPERMRQAVMDFTRNQSGQPGNPSNYFNINDSRT